MSKIYAFLICIISSTFILAQNPTFTWARMSGGPTNDMGWGITYDASGNVYVTGEFTGTNDFDPGPGVYTLTAGNTDAYILKLDASGNFLWARQLGGSSNAGTETGYGITVDASGNVYTIGEFNTQADFDPGVGIYNMSFSGGSGTDIYISKLDANGNFVFAQQFGGSAVTDFGYDIRFDGTNLVATGFFQGTPDFDPGAGTYTMTASVTEDVFILKLTTAGTFVWAKQLGGTGAERGRGIEVDGSGNVYTVGRFGSTCDFDPGVGTYTLSSAGGSNDVFVSKLNSSGNFVWAKSFTGPSSDYGYAVAVDVSGNVYITGEFDGTVDFDPGAGTFNITGSSPGFFDLFISKLDMNGNFVWAKTMGSTANDTGQGIDIDGTGNVVSTGFSGNTIDMDPGAGVYNVAGGAYISKLDAAGNFIFGGVMPGQGRDVQIDASNSYYFTGWGSGGDYDAGVTTFTLNPVGGYDIYAAKYNGCPITGQPGAINGLSSMCTGAGASTYSIATVAGATSYTWSLPAGWSGSSSTNTISATPGATGIFTVTASNACGTSPQQTLNVTVNPLPTISVNSGSICSGNSFTIIPSGANTYTIQGGSTIVSPTVTTSYSIAGSNTAGCVSASSATSSITVNALPTVGANAVPSASVCMGSSLTLSGTGATTYTWSAGVTNAVAFTPTVSLTYTVTGTDSNGCQNSATKSLTVNPLPTISAATTNTLLCAGQTATLTASGASTYTFNPGGPGTSIAVSPTITVTYTITGTDSNGCTNSTAFTQSVSTCAGLSAIALAKEDLSIFPNPSSGIFKINISQEEFEKIQITIFNILGKEVASSPLSNGEGPGVRLDQPNGIYFVSIGSIIKKIIKQ